MEWWSQRDLECNSPREGSNVWRTHITREVDSLKSSEQKEIKSWELIETLFGD